MRIRKVLFHPSNLNPGPESALYAAENDHVEEELSVPEHKAHSQRPSYYDHIDVIFRILLCLWEHVAFANGGRKPGWRCLKIAIEIKAIAPYTFYPDHENVGQYQRNLLRETDDP